MTMLLISLSISTGLKPLVNFKHFIRVCLRKIFTHGERQVPKFFRVFIFNNVNEFIKNLKGNRFINFSNYKILAIDY